MAHRDLQAGLGGQGGQLGFPRPGTVTVGATRIRCDQQPVGLWIVGAAAGLPPAADRGDCERGGVVVAPDVDPAGVRGHVVDAVRDRLAGLPVEEVVRVDLDRFTLRAPLPAVVLVRADQFLLFGGLPGSPWVACARDHGPVVRVSRAWPAPTDAIPLRRKPAGPPLRRQGRFASLARRPLRAALDPGASAVPSTGLWAGRWPAPALCAARESQLLGRFAPDLPALRMTGRPGLSTHGEPG